jgi:hypothetical protein
MADNCFIFLLFFINFIVIFDVQNKHNSICGCFLKLTESDSSNICTF